LIRTFSRARRPPRLNRCCVLCPILFLSALACLAQERGPVAQRPIQSATELVKIEASVLDHDGNFVGGLVQSSFRILDNGVEQPIAFFEPVEAPAQVLVLLETSPAVYLISEQHLAAAYSLLDGLAPDDEVALVTYDAAPHPALAFTADKPALLAALSKPQYTIGMADLNFYDSLSTVLDWLAPVTGKKAIVVLTTGLDSSAPARWDSLVQKLRGNDVVIFSVALGGTLRAAPPKKAKQKKSTSATGSADEQALAESITAAGFAKADDALRSPRLRAGARIFRNRIRSSRPSIGKSPSLYATNTSSASFPLTTTNFTRSTSKCSAAAAIPTPGRRIECNIESSPAPDIWLRARDSYNVVARLRIRR